MKTKPKTKAVRELINLKTTQRQGVQERRGGRCCRCCRCCRCW